MNSQKMTTRQKFVLVVAFLLLFIFLMAYYNNVNPLVLFDMDDWRNIFLKRSFLPEWKGFNPTKILPETSMSFMAKIGAYLIMPLMGGKKHFIDALQVSFSLGTAAAWLFYFGMFYQFIRKFVKGHFKKSLLVFLFAILLHFVAMVTVGTSLISFLNGPNVTCIFHYTIPVLVNGAFVFFMITHDSLRLGKTSLKDHSIFYGVIFIWVYLCINSNMFTSILVVSYVIAILVLDLIRHHESVRDYLHTHAFLLVIFVMWLISLFFEYHGGRSSAIHHSFTFGYLPAYFATMIPFKNMFKVILLVIAVGYFYVKIKNKGSFALDVKLLVSFVILFIYMYILLVITGFGYATRAGVLFVRSFYLLVFMIYALAYMMRHSMIPSLVMPFCIVWVCIILVAQVDQFPRNCVNGYTATTVKAINQDLITQIVKASQEGKEQVDVYVPYFSDNNWPLTIDGGETVSLTLKQYGLIDHDVKVQFKSSIKKNQKFHI